MGVEEDKLKKEEMVDAMCTTGHLLGEVLSLFHLLNQLFQNLTILYRSCRKADHYGIS